MKHNIILEGDATAIRDWLAGGQFYQLEVGGRDLLTAIERGWLSLSGDYDSGQIDKRTALGTVRITIEALP